MRHLVPILITIAFAAGALLGITLFLVSLPAATPGISFINSFSEVRDIVKENPDADLQVVLWREDQIAKNADAITKDCGAPLPPGSHYRIELSERGRNTIYWLAADTLKLLCISVMDIESVNTDLECTSAGGRWESCFACPADAPCIAVCDTPHCELDLHCAELSEAACEADATCEDIRLPDGAYARCALRIANNPVTATGALFAQAQKAGLELAAFESCLDARATAASVEENYHAGIAAGITGIPTTFINGQTILGVPPYSTFISLIEDELAHPTTAVVMESDRHRLGNATAPVAISHFCDFEEDACVRFFVQIEPLLRRDYVETGRASFTYHHFPLDIDPLARQAAEAADCAVTQGKFWDFHDTLYRNHAQWTAP